jgi:ATP-dependent helicase/nuclease subunit A
MVDEFQDTDPLQAEVCFLLASDPSEGKDWRAVNPRAGALFVVGDPKQSIYRFRRADIETYDLVKRRMAALGAVVQLTRNFRSTPEIGDFVNNHFVNVFPETASEVQAPYSPLLANKPAGNAGVVGYSVIAGNKDAIYEDDAARIASWIADRLQQEVSRKPEDFLILSWRREPVLGIARALAERNVPAVATGANVGVEEEVEELLVVLKALADPANAVNVVAALQGMFVGASPADIFDAHSAGLKFSLLDDPGSGVGIIADGLRLLRRWHALSLSTPPDSLVDTLLDETGVLALTAGEEIGDTRAGMLLRIVSMLRASATESTGSMSDAIQRIEEMLANDIEGEPTLRPGRGDAVRVMNLHQAKGLEAEIVVLASPYKPSKSPPVELHVKRVGSSKPMGWMKINVPESKWTDVLKTAGQPPAWDEKEALETTYLQAEHERLRYVAATRAKSELWISQLVGDPKTTGQWECFTNSLPSPGLEELEITLAPGRLQLMDTVEDISNRLIDAENKRVVACEASYTIASVTQSAKETLIARAEGEGGVDEKREKNTKGRGRAWGRAVHRVIEAMGSGRAGEGLAQFASAVVGDEFASSLNEEIVENTKSILSLAAQLTESPEWMTLMSCEERHFELPVTQVSTESGTTAVIEGVIDAAGFDGKSWHVFDWKTDHCDDDEWATRLPVYQAQVDAYAKILAELYGHAANGSIVRITDRN